jgi:hypothetical protein
MSEIGLGREIQGDDEEAPRVSEMEPQLTVDPYESLIVESLDGPWADHGDADAHFEERSFYADQDPNDFSITSVDIEESWDPTDYE